MITPDDFKVFQEPTLAGRLGLIQSQIDPKFEEIGTAFVADFEAKTQWKFYLHLAKHLRRHKNPPPDTWLAIGEGVRGYKMLPHFEIGLWPNHLFVWFSLLAEVKQKETYGKKLQQLPTQLDLFSKKDLQIAQDHTQAEAVNLTEANYQRIVTRFCEIKKGEFLIGRLIPAGDEIFQDELQQTRLLKTTMAELLEVYEVLRLE